MKYHWTVFTSDGQPQIRTCLKLGFHLIQSLKGVLSTNFERPLFRMYKVVLIALPHKYFGKLYLHIIFLTIFLKVPLRLSVTPFCSRVSRLCVEKQFYNPTDTWPKDPFVVLNHYICHNTLHLDHTSQP